MGGKHKQAQRTKNNARPSSSGRSAELLGSIPQFVGFSGMKESGIIMPGFSLSTDDMDSSIDTNFQLVLKKMNKKDSTTKLKALQEFTDLVKAAEVECLKTVLPFWPRLYCALATDADHKVREAAHVAHHQVVLKAKRNLAPFLKQLAGPWFTSQYDNYAPAASAAKKSFQDAFPENKIQDAIVFCQEEILSYICDNLTVQTAQSLSNTKTTSPEDAEAKFQRVLICSLQGYALYLNTLSTGQIEKESELNSSLTSNAKFWKLAKHKVAPVRAAWFGVISALCVKVPALRDKEVTHVVGAVFGSLDEGEPTVLPAVWEAAMAVLSSVTDWWKHVNVDKLIFPKLWKVLREGGQGNASVIFPNLLPVISHLPPTSDMQNVYCLFFENMRAGFKHKNVIGSRSESIAVSVAFIECLQYIVMKHQSDVALCEKLIKSHLFPLLEWGLTDPQASYKNIFNQVSTLVQYWNRNLNNSEFSNYPRYLEYFWKNLTSLFEGLMLNLEHNFEPNAVSQLANRQIEFLLSLKHLVKPKKNLKVSFAEAGVTSPTEENRPNLSDSYLKSLNGLAYRTCENFVTFVNEKRSKELMEYLVSLIQDFDTELFFLHLNEQFGGRDLIEVYRQLLLKWLRSKVLCSKSVVELVFLLFKYLKADGKLEILSGFMNNQEAFGWCLGQALSHPHYMDAVVLTWLQNEQVSNFLVGIAEKELADDCKPEESLLLKQAFSEKPDGELFISKDGVLRIIHTLNRSLLDPNSYTATIDACASFVAYISAIVYTAPFKLKYGDDLYLAMFTLLNSSVNSDYLSKDTSWEVNTAWQDASCILARELPPEEFDLLTEKCARIIERKAFDVELAQTADIIIGFVRCLRDNNLLRIEDILIRLLRRDFLIEWREALTDVCVNAELIRGNLCCYDCLEVKEIEEANIEKYFVWISLMAEVLVKPIADDCDEEEADVVVSTTVVKMIDVGVEILEMVLDVLYSLALADSFSRNYVCTKYGSVVNKSYERIKTHVQNLIQIVGKDITRALEESLIKAASKGFLWAYALKIFHSEIVSRDLSEVYVNVLKSEANSLALLHLTQVFAPNLTYEQARREAGPLGGIVVLRSLIHCDEIEVPIAGTFSKIDSMYLQDSGRFYYENSASLTWQDAAVVSEIMRFYSAVITKKPECLETKHLNEIVIRFAVWSTNIAKCRMRIKDVQISFLMTALTDLYISLNSYIINCDKESIINEWRDVFIQDIHKDLVDIWLCVCEQHEDFSRNILSLPFLQEFGRVLSHVDHSYLFAKKHQNLPKWPKLLKHSCSLVTDPSSTLQLWGYHMLAAMIPGLIEVDSVAVNTNTPHEKGLIFEQFKEVLTLTEEVVQSMLLDFRLGEDSCTVEPFTDSYSFTFAYFLVWDVLLTLCEKSSTELCYQYADWLKKEEFLNHLLDNIYKLMPLEIMQHVDGKSRMFADKFTNKLSSSLTEKCSSERIEHMVCWVYSLALAQLAPLVRQWWGQQETRTKQIVERVTTSFVSPQLCQKELADVEQHENKFKNMVIKVHPSVREVVAVYTVDEAQMELVISLPPNYPLKSPEVQCNRQIYGTSHKQWLMQLKMCVQHQNGRIWDGLSLWNNNLDKKFDGVEECYICFAVLHQGTYQLPKLTCQTCRKKFHSACLYKWFSTSNKSTCPICRHLF